jgi:hypothetical protein
MSFDLSSLEVVEGAEMTVMHPVEDIPLDGSDGKPVVFKVVGIDSEQYRAAQRSAQNRRLSKKTRMKITAEQLEHEVLESIVACTVGWSNNFEVDGAAMKFSAENAKTLYQRFPWLREQVQDFIEDRANFLRR